MSDVFANDGSSSEITMQVSQKASEVVADTAKKYLLDFIAGDKSWFGYSVSWKMQLGVSLVASLLLVWFFGSNNGTFFGKFIWFIILSILFYILIGVFL